MTECLSVRSGLLALALIVPTATVTADANDLLARMQKASRNLDYDGVFVYQRGDQLESLRIIHKANAGRIQERLISLNGTPREIVRNDREIRCFLPDEDAVLVEHRRAEGRNFPALLPDSLAVLKESYKIRLGKEGRVAGRKSRAVLIKPRDQLRYGYQLWADKDSGLLLKASLINEQGALIEQYMFTQIAIGSSIPDSALQPQTPASKLKRPPPESMEFESASEGWSAGEIPDGFRLTARMRRSHNGPRPPMEHLVYSDGLAMVSVSIEPRVDRDQDESLVGVSRIGAVHVYGRLIDGHRVTVMGEVPAATISMIGNSLLRQP